SSARRSARTKADAPQKTDRTTKDTKDTKKDNGPRQGTRLPAVFFFSCLWCLSWFDPSARSDAVNDEAHLDALIRHLGLVRDACILLGKRLIAQGRPEFGRLLIARGFIHDVSKFYGLEWEHVRVDHAAPGSSPVRELAIEHHRKTNDHHPEY